MEKCRKIPRHGIIKKTKKKKIQKESSEKYQNLSKMEKSKKSYSMGVKDSKISLKIKSKG